MNVYVSELIGTMIMIFLGDCVVANVCLKKTKGHDGGLVSIASGWAFAVVIPAFIFGPLCGAHFNSAITIALACTGKFPINMVFGYIASQMIGAFLGACLVYVFYKDHFDQTEDADVKLCIFCTTPAIANKWRNFLSEFMATFLLVYAILGISNTTLCNQSPQALHTMGVGIIIWSIGVSLGGTTGYAINPARDLGPRLAHFLLPISNKRNSNWSYAWIPIIGPIAGAIAAAFCVK